MKKLFFLSIFFVRVVSISYGQNEILELDFGHYGLKVDTSTYHIYGSILLTNLNKNALCIEKISNNSGVTMASFKTNQKIPFILLPNESIDLQISTSILAYDLGRDCIVKDKNYDQLISPISFVISGYIKNINNSLRDSIFFFNPLARIKNQWIKK